MFFSKIEIQQLSMHLLAYLLVSSTTELIIKAKSMGSGCLLFTGVLGTESVSCVLETSLLESTFSSETV